MNEVLEVIRKVTGRRLETVREGAQKGDMRDTFADTAAAQRDLGFKSTIPLREGLRREWEWIEACDEQTSRSCGPGPLRRGLWKQT